MKDEYNCINNRLDRVRIRKLLRIGLLSAPDLSDAQLIWGGLLGADACGAVVGFCKGCDTVPD